MTGLFGWVPNRVSDVWPTLAAMGCALQAHDRELWAAAEHDGIGIGVIDGIDADRVGEWAQPAISADGQHALWLAGEIFEAGTDTPSRPQDASALGMRQIILDRLLAHGPAGIAAIDGEFQIAWWDRASATLTLIGDRFAGLQWYWGHSPQGIAFACGVRGVLMAPGMPTTPDRDAIRDAVTFGGFRLGTNTNVEGVRMLPGAALATIRCNRMSLSRWWHWNDIVERQSITLDDAIDGAHTRWQRAIARRLRGAMRPGQTLSGGFDSRAILAEAAPQVAQWSAITYGVPGCEDARYAQAAADSVRARWFFYELYRGDWLAERSAHIQQTDGLIQLGDLMHFESLPLQRAHLDVHLSGYIGDAVSGATFNDIATPEQAMLALPYYETPISRGWGPALDRVAEETEDATWLATRFVPFEHKLPQSTNRWSAGWRPWLRVRKPFTDYEFFDFCQSLPPGVRGAARFYEHWLRCRYPLLFAKIPAHKTGAPAAASDIRVQRARIARALRRTWNAAADRIKWRREPWSRAFHDEPAAWSQPSCRALIEATVLRPGSIAVDEWGRPAIAALLNGWFDEQRGPTQVIGALYTFEAYHAALGAHLGAAATAARRVDQRRPPVTIPSNQCG